MTPFLCKLYRTVHVKHDEQANQSGRYFEAFKSALRCEKYVCHSIQFSVISSVLYLRLASPRSLRLSFGFLVAVFSKHIKHGFRRMEAADRHERCKTQQYARNVRTVEKSNRNSSWIKLNKRREHFGHAEFLVKIHTALYYGSMILLKKFKNKTFKALSSIESLKNLYNLAIA